MPPIKVQRGNEASSLSTTTNSPPVVESEEEDGDEEREEDPVLTSAVIPPDGGWGWVIVAAAFFGCLIVDGIIFSFGIIFPDILEYFGDGTSKTSWIGSMMAGMYLTIGELTTNIPSSSSSSLL